MKNKISSILLICFGSISFLSGCRIGQEIEDETKTNINVTVFDGTARTAYMENAALRFEALNTETSFEEGKTGVHIDVTSVGNVPNDKANIDISDSDIFLDENKPNIYENSHQGLLLDISDVVQPIENKIDSGSLKGCKGFDDKYYALPHYSWYTGVTYNKTILDENNLYFADPNELNSVAAIGADKFFEHDNVKMIRNSNSKKSVGPDGIENTSDDGLPSSLQEFAIWCAYCLNKNITPFRIAGSQPTYSMYITHGIWSALAGPEKMKAYYQNYSDTPIEVVKKDASGNTKLTNQELFFEGSKIYIPETESIIINEANNNGYRVTDMVERYYSLAFFELIFNEKWFSKEYKKGSSDTHLYAMSDFVNGSDDDTVNRCAILCDASYWYHEATAKSIPSSVAVCLIVALPVTLLFIIFKDKLMGDISLGGIKE